MGVRQNNFLKFLRFLIFWLRLKRFPKTFQLSHPRIDQTVWETVWGCGYRKPRFLISR